MNSDYLVGKVIDDRYEILDIIGSGGMATVYKAKCRVLNRYVAIKVLKDSLKYDAEVVKKFKVESRAAAGLSHPNIVQVYDVGESDGLEYIVMELVEGITLKDYINKKGRIPWETACDYAIQIGKALDCAHSHHIVHRDIKPHNVLITKDGILKVADFGIAQAAGSETMVAGKSSMGSVHYISPEQARGGYTDERSDVYSLGVVLYEMLTGTVPFNSDNAVTIALMKLEESPRDCRDLNPDIPEDVAKIVMKAISKEQHLRYQAAISMVNDLEIATGRTVTVDDYGDFSQNDSFDETKRLNSEETRSEFYSRRNFAGHRKKNTSKQLSVPKLFALAVAAVVVIAFIIYFVMSGGTPEYQVPDLTNMTLEEAEDAVEKANLQLDENVIFEESEEFEDGHIIRQDPGINQYVKKNRKIKVTISSGIGGGKIEIPDVENLKFEDAVKELVKKKLSYKKVEKYDKNIEYGYVISQSPKSGSKVSEGYAVILYVSALEDDYDSKISVPKLTGHTEDEAKILLKEAGLVLGSVSSLNSTADVGTIISQSPPAKYSIEKGGSVNIVVSKGAEEQATVAPTHTPAPTPTPVLKRKTLTITIPDDANETVHIKAVANDKVIYDQTHSKSEKTVDIPVQSSKDAHVQVYIDGAIAADKVISFE
ncbi:MAG: Stk1 family PASTA domain-containing Ser/Thr kinase [Firmicutes bacterium]|nr:Stk1 family PASTA domain-containing Ser/Thr kinase [Bacillota bacterium]